MCLILLVAKERLRPAIVFSVRPLRPAGQLAKAACRAACQWRRQLQKASQRTASAVVVRKHTQATPGGAHLAQTWPKFEPKADDMSSELDSRSSCSGPGRRVPKRKLLH